MSGDAGTVNAGTGDAAAWRDRAESARLLLSRAGVTATVTAEGTDGEIAAVRGSPSLRGELMRLAPEIRALGFRYVALELDPVE